MKLQKVAIASIIFLSSGLLSSMPANSATAIKSGQACATANAVKKVKFKGDTYVYKCVKNPRYKKTTLTWTLDECLVAIADFKEAKAKNDALVAAGGTPTELDVELLGLARQLRNMSCKAGI